MRAHHAGGAIALVGAALLAVSVPRLVVGRSSAPAAPEMDAARAAVWWYRPADTALVRAAPDRESDVLGCLPADAPIEEAEDSPVNGWRHVVAQGWSGWIHQSELGAGWHANAQGHSFAPLVDC